MALTRRAFAEDASVVIAALETDVRQGLGDAEALDRLARYGRNELTEEAPESAWKTFFAQFRDAMVVLLLIATAISAGLWFWERDTALPYESIAILAVVLLNAVMGFVQQTRAASAIAALRTMSANQATVIRNGERRTMPASELVPGDIILVEEGDTIPADCRLVDETALQTAEAALTGESLPVSKDAATIAGDTVSPGDQLNMLFSGTSVTYGHGIAVVTATGMQTEMGRVAGMLEVAPHDLTPLQRELNRTGKLLGIIVVAIAIVMIATILVVGKITDPAGIVEVLILGVALAVAAVPEGLPTVVTAVLSIGVQRMARRRAIVRHLAAVETLGSASVIASDKTGTLTKNEMTVRVVVTASGRVRFTGTGYAPEGHVQRDGGGAIDGPLQFELERALTAADRANNATVVEQEGRWTVQGDPTEGALLVAARKAGLESAALDTNLPRVGEVPFSSERKLMSTIHGDAAHEDRGVVFTKGAPDILLKRCAFELVGEERRALTAERRAEILRDNEALAAQALRTLGVAGRWFDHAPEMESGTGADAADIEQQLVFAGLIGMIDPPRSEAAAAVARAVAAGIRPLMITGDHPRTASVIAMELGIAANDKVLTGAELEVMTDEALDRAVTDVSVYARVNPGHKLRIVNALQRSGAIVAMTGDGVNDAPALKTANIGIAMGIMGTDVAKQAADIILADDNFATIISAVEEGRTIFANIRKFLRFLLSSNIGEVLVMFFGVLLGRSLGLRGEPGEIVLPLLATQMLWINLITDGAPALALGVDAADEELMHAPPRSPAERVITPDMWWGIMFVGIVMAAGTLAVLDAAMPGGFIEGTGTVRYAHSMAFTTLMLAQLFNTLNARSDYRSAFVHMFTNAWLWGAIALSVALQLLVLNVAPMQRAFGTVALGVTDWMRCVAVASTVLWLTEVAKVIKRKTATRRR